jgi:predicted unusual protein kinase regulating ubiquinone biosynthesis (AarF/ABC1/UbiB family)
VEEFARSMMEQLDLRNEAKNMLRFQRTFSGPLVDPTSFSPSSTPSMVVLRRGTLLAMVSLDIKDVVVPKVIPELTNENVLVETFEDGQPMNVVRRQAAPKAHAALRRRAPPSDWPCPFAADV